MSLQGKQISVVEPRNGVVTFFVFPSWSFVTWLKSGIPSFQHLIILHNHRLRKQVFLFQTSDFPLSIIKIHFLNSFYKKVLYKQKFENKISVLLQSKQGMLMLWVLPGGTRQYLPVLEGARTANRQLKCWNFEEPLSSLCFLGEPGWVRACDRTVWHLWGHTEESSSSMCNSFPIPADGVPFP